MTRALVNSFAANQQLSGQPTTTAQLTSAFVDLPKRVEVKAAWTTYRQDLRDIPQDTSDPESVVWPVEPA